MEETDYGELGEPPTIGAYFSKGITIEPKFTYTVGDLALYLKVKFGNIGINSETLDAYKDYLDKKLGASVAPTFGVTYAF
jgi:hypothetical protein